MKQPIAKKKHFRMLPAVKDFMRDQDGDAKKELNGIVLKLEAEGVLTMPYGEKLDGENLFAIRVIQAANIRVFYVYGMQDIVFGIHAYTKKTQDIPEKEKQQARRIVKQLVTGGLVK
ncbi:MAG: type II toxin-antitoxin system RelE/ParE family toxin [Oscillospiraceae bacterium]|nr:type II toxin-antitoxin system RelE/ParE family toxin [Oscillospiraceae bacterium]